MFTSCNNSQVKEPGSYYSVEKNDSLDQLRTAVYLFDKSEKTVVDSLKKYHLTELADSCLKFFYVVRCMEKANDSLWCNGNVLTIGESNIRLTGFVKKDVDKKQISFGVFLNDSIPCSMQLKPAGFPVGFIVSVKQKIIIDVMVGEYTKMYFRDFKKYYDSLVISDGFKGYLHSKSGSIHPTFKRLIFP